MCISDSRQLALWHHPADPYALSNPGNLAPLGPPNLPNCVAVGLIQPLGVHDGLGDAGPSCGDLEQLRMSALGQKRTETDYGVSMHAKGGRSCELTGPGHSISVLLEHF